jgi:5'-nucleotidase (lipoprotein e(P4) family)
MRRWIPAVLLLASCTTTTTPPPAPAPAAPVAAAVATCNPGHSILNAVLWVQSSAEFQAASRQTFATARRALDEALEHPSWIGAAEDTVTEPAQPPAIIVDVDETVLDNTPFEARVVQAGMTFDEKMWKDWVAEASAEAMPGAADFLKYAQSRGVAVFYITNRDEDERPGTLANLQKLGLPLDPNVDTLLLRQDPKVSDKSPRRKQVADRYRVLLLVGDDLNDFANMRSRSWQERHDHVIMMRDWWGTRWFVVPNPMYGSFERAVIGSGAAPCEAVERKVKVLKP